MKSGGFVIDPAGLTNVAAGADRWEKVVRKLRTQAMPPPGAPRPDAATYDRVAVFLESELDRAEAARPHLGKLPLAHRLSRTEYRNAVRDLLALEALPREVSIDYLLPADNISSGFDNIADLLFVSPSSLERYLDAARKISRLAVGDPAMPVMVNIHPLDPEHPQDERVDELPFGTRGGIAVRSEFPVDGTYIVKVDVGNAQGHELEITVDGERVALRALGADAAVLRSMPRPVSPIQPIPIPRLLRMLGRRCRVEGRRRRSGGCSWCSRCGGRARGTCRRQRTRRRCRRAARVPAHAEGGTEADWRRVRAAHRCARRGDAAAAHAQSRHAAGDQQRDDQRPLQRHGPRRFAQPAAHLRLPPGLSSRRTPMRAPHPLDARAPRLPSSGDRGRRPGSAAVLRARPQGGQLRSRDPESPGASARQPAVPLPHRARACNRAAGAAYRVSDLELASRLSFFIWSSIPDDELLDAAAAGRLKDPKVLEQQVRRMLADPRSESLVTNFAAQWLYLRDIEAKQPDEILFADFDETLRAAMQRETELFIGSVFKENTQRPRPADRELHVPQRAAGAALRRAERAGQLLPPGHVSGGQRARRPAGAGKRADDHVVLDAHLAGAARQMGAREPAVGRAAASAADVPSLKTETAPGKPLTLRDAMIQHRAAPACASCHARMDPIGFAMENFDAVGRWRERDGEQPIDATGVFPEGTKFEGIPGLKRELLRSARAVRRHRRRAAADVRHRPQPAIL